VLRPHQWQQSNEEHPELLTMTNATTIERLTIAYSPGYRTHRPERTIRTGAIISLCTSVNLSCLQFTIIGISLREHEKPPENIL